MLSSYWYFQTVLLIIMRQFAFHSLFQVYFAIMGKNNLYFYQTESNNLLRVNTVNAWIIVEGFSFPFFYRPVQRIDIKLFDKDIKKRDNKKETSTSPGWVHNDDYKNANRINITMSRPLSVIKWRVFSI